MRHDDDDPPRTAHPEPARVLPSAGIEAARAAGLADADITGLAQAYARGVGRIVAAELAVTARAMAAVPEPEREAWLRGWVDRLAPLTGPTFQAFHDDLFQRGVAHLATHPEAVTHRELAVAFVDLRGSTRFMLEGSRDDIRALVDVLFGCAQEIAAAFDVRIVKHLGDGFLLDGHDRDEVLAAAASAVTRLGERTSLDAAAGVDHGEVTTRAGDHFGPPVNFASRLAEVAPPGGLAIGALAVPDPPPAGGEWRDVAVRGLPEPPRVLVVDDATVLGGSPA